MQSRLLCQFYELLRLQNFISLPTQQWAVMEIVGVFVLGDAAKIEIVVAKPIVLVVKVVVVVKVLDFAYVIVLILVGNLCFTSDFHYEEKDYRDSFVNRLLRI